MGERIKATCPVFIKLWIKITQFLFFFRKELDVLRQMA
jgi:hypothetical protein